MITVLLLSGTLFFGCAVDSAKNHYVLAEKLWSDGKYQAAVTEFEKVTQKDPRGKIGTQALFRAAMTQYLFLSQYPEAIKKLRTYIQSQTDPAAIWHAELQIGDILYSKLENYELAIAHYQRLLKLKPESEVAAEFFYRIGKSHFYLFQFEEAILEYRKLAKEFPESSWAEKANFEIGTVYFTQGSDGGNGNEGYEKAMKAFKHFIKRYPKSSQLAEAHFGMALCLEELDELDDAYQTYVELRNLYPSPQVIEMKLSRIQTRIAKRGMRSRK